MGQSRTVCPVKRLPLRSYNEASRDPKSTPLLRRCSTDPGSGRVARTSGIAGSSDASVHVKLIVRGKMASLSVCQQSCGGFSFENCKRNALLESEFSKQGHYLPSARKTGTTICGVVYKDGVVLGADTRATEGMVVADKNCAKIHYISPNIYCCGAGTAADTEMTTQLISSNLELHSLSTGRLPRVATANRMLKQMLFSPMPIYGFAAPLAIIYPVVKDCEHLTFINIQISKRFTNFCSQLGSGSLAAMAVFEDRYKEDMEEEEAKQLVRDAIAAGIFNDLGSGSNVDLCVITKNKIDYLRPHDLANKKGVRSGSYKYKRGTTGVVTKSVTQLDLEVIDEVVQTMDTS
ncbi:PSB7 protein, partial [Polypterus senegalus]|nr:PSB7 protein [Polypterus senegalus]